MAELPDSLQEVIIHDLLPWGYYISDFITHSEENHLLHEVIPSMF